MGNGIAHVFARAGYKVILRDVERKYLDRAMETISKNLEREVKKGKIDEAEKGNTFARLQPVVEMSAIAVADFAVEAVPEKIEIKRAVLSEADKILREGVVIASNTSSIAMTALAALTKRPERFVDRKSTRLNSSHVAISYAVFCLKKKTKEIQIHLTHVIYADRL